MTESRSELSDAGSGVEALRQRILQLERRVRELEQLDAETGRLQPLVLDSLPLGIVVAGADGNVIYENLAARQLLRRGEVLASAESEFRYNESCRLFASGDQQPYSDRHAVLRRVLAGEKSVVDDLEMRCEDATYFLTCTGVPLHNEAGDIEGAIAIVSDVTERREIEEELWKTKVLVEHSPVVLFRVRADQMLSVEHISQNIAQYGYAARDLLSGSISLASIMHPEDLQRVIRKLVNATERGIRSIVEEHRLFTSNGEVRWVDARLVIVSDSDGNPTHYQGIMLDITDRKRLEVQLVQSQKMEITGRLAGSVAHEFNNVLTAIIGYSSLARDALFPRDPVRDDIQQVINISQRAATFTHRLLAFARRQTSPPVALDLNEFIADMEDLLRRLLPESIDFVFKPAPKLNVVEVDPGQMEHLLISVLMNARESMPSGGRLIIETGNVMVDDDFVRMHEGAVPGDYVMLRMHSTEMTSSHEAALLATVFRGRSQQRAGVPALSSIYTIVRGLQGEIWQTSDEGGGTIQEIILPSSSRSVLKESDMEAASVALAGKETILVVEDENTVRGPVVRFLRDLGYKVIEADNGVDALLMAESHEGEIDLLVTDVVMPQMNGIALASELAKNRPGIRVLLMSGYADDDLSRYGSLNQPTGFLQKPFAAPMLARKMREMLET